MQRFMTSCNPAIADAEKSNLLFHKSCSTSIDFFRTQATTFERKPRQDPNRGKKEDILTQLVEVLANIRVLFEFDLTPTFILKLDDSVPHGGAHWKRREIITND